MKRKMLRMILVGCLLLTSLLWSGTALAQDEALPDPGMTPDSPFYFFDTMGKNVGMFFTFGSEAKAGKALEYAGERLAEARAMAAKNKVREMTRAANDYEGFMATVNERMEAAVQQGTSENISERLALAVSNHLSVLDGIKDQVPGQDGEVIARVRAASMNGQENALRALGREKLERAVEIGSAAIENRLQRAMRKAAGDVTSDNATSENATSENMTSEVNENLDYAARIAEIEEELLALAQEKGIDVTALEQRLAQSTSNRLEVLAGVYEKVPEQAKQAVANAIENSVEKYERAVEKLKEKGALGEIPEEAPVMQRIREEVKERLQVQTATEAHTSDNISGQVRTQSEVQERTQAEVSEQAQNLRPATPGAEASENKTGNNGEANDNGKAKGQKP
jgi:hypothetical protein